MEKRSCGRGQLKFGGANPVAQRNGIRCCCDVRFSVSHTTFYEYAQPASESVAELRLRPVSNPVQVVESRALEVDPKVGVGSFTDYWGNRVEYFAIPFRHSTLRIVSRSIIETNPQEAVDYCSEITVAEARQIVNKSSTEAIEYLRPSRLVPIGSVLKPLRKQFVRGDRPLLETVWGANKWIHERFKYVPGATDVRTPLDEVISIRKGVCQDFAHVLLSILRTGGIPARYVSGYIEAVDPTRPDSKLIGAAASHAWVEVLLPGGRWWGVDPTNDQAAGERHIKVAVGRDYDDIAPFRGTFTGVTEQKLEVAVKIKRLKPKGRGPRKGRNKRTTEKT